MPSLYDNDIKITAKWTELFFRFFFFFFFFVSFFFFLLEGSKKIEKRCTKSTELWKENVNYHERFMALEHFLLWLVGWVLWYINLCIAQSTGAVEQTDCTYAEG